MNFIEKNIIIIFLSIALIGILLPNCFLWTKHLTHPMLSLLAFCVGLTLKSQSLANVWHNKKVIISILTFKYTIIPSITFLTCSFCKIPNLLTIGLVTLTCCPAANTGNILCFLSKGNTAMIIMTTIFGALISPFITPYIIYIFLNKIVRIELNQIIFLISTAITLPMLAGMLLQHQISNFISKLQKYIPSIGIILVALIISSITAQNANQLNQVTFEILLLCVFLITTFLSIGYLFSRLIRCSVENSIAMSYEMGTFDGILGILLTAQIAGNNASLSVIIFAILNIILGGVATKLYISKRKLEYDL